MKKSFLIPLVCSVSFASQSLPMVHYDPFYKSQKILKVRKLKANYPNRFRKLHLTAIYNDKAYIDGKFYRVGQRVGEYELVRITQNGVVLKKNTQRLILRLAKPKNFVKIKDVEKVQ